MNLWPEPHAIQDELPPVNAFREEFLPDSLRPLVTDIAERLQVPMDFPGVALVVCLAGAVNRRARIQPKAKDTSWVLQSNLWGGLIGDPGSMKSPTIKAVIRPLTNIEKDHQNDHRQAMEAYESEGEDGERPVAKRLIVNDATPEKLHVIMSQNPEGLLLFRDELTGLLAEFEQSGRETERAFFLQSWDGDISHTMDRIGRGTVYAATCCLSILGGIQPALLKRYLSGENGLSLQSDGLIQRCSMLVWPDRIERRYVDRAPNAAAEQCVETIFRRLVALEEEASVPFRFAQDAQEDLFVPWYQELQTKIDMEESPVIASHLSKYPKLMPTLALLFELADMAAGSFEGFEGLGRGGRVSYEHTRQAIEFCEYLQSHARRIYSCVRTPEKHAAILLADKIKDHGLGHDGIFTFREVQQKDWRGLKNAEVIRGALAVLEKAGWIRDITTKPGSGSQGGRPSIRYEINPKIWA